MISANVCDHRFKNPFSLIYHSVLPESNRNPKEALLFKDRFFISDHVYQSFTNQFSLPLPTLYCLKKLRKEMNEEFSLVYSVSKSVFIEPKQRIKDQLFKNENCEDRLLNVKIAADGTNIDRDLILNESKKAKTAVGNYTLGISKLNEDYDGLEEPIKYIINNIKDLKKFEFKGNNYEIQNLVLERIKSKVLISDVLIRLFVKDLCSYVNVGNNTKIDLKKHIYLAKYIKCLNEKCKIKLDHFDSPVKGNITRDFVGEIPKIELINKIWLDFFEIYTMIKKNSLIPDMTRKKTKD
ncbi:hypothetical protein BpHYR1_016151 [Brachionus plicatilis]|uniref:Uncharacterized protein n=1 Tax=Brachionus plicatilis TaxID=10195 RepID=A0A3M7RPU2_BRAPC|nr:hypothetical protein BpHYR1_016151 [Brachionus plicatilis]